MILVVIAPPALALYSSFFFNKSGGVLTIVKRYDISCYSPAKKQLPVAHGLTHSFCPAGDPLPLNLTLKECEIKTINFIHFIVQKTLKHVLQKSFP